MTKIRDVDTLEDLRVSLSMQLEEAKKTVKSQDDLLQVKQLRIALNDVVDELVAAKNIAADAEKERRLEDIRSHEADNIKHYKEYHKLLQVIVPCLKQVVDNLDRANQLASWLQSDRSSITQLQGHYNKEYNESIEVKPHSARGVPDHDQVTRVLEWLQGDLDSYEAKAGKAKSIEAIAEGNTELAGGSKVMQSVIKNKAEVEAAGKV